MSVETAARRFADALPAGLRVGIAISGGSDSTGLLLALSQAIGPGRLEAFTVDHGFRAASAEEARQVRALCRQLGILHRTLKRTGPVPQSGLQAFAREARQHLLLDAARARGLSVLALGHSEDDQDETIRMRQARGAVSLTARAGMAGATLVYGSLWLVRPFLTVTRATIRTCLRDNGYGWIDDPSNNDTRFERVRLRLVPDADGRPERLAAAMTARRELVALHEAAARILETAQGSPWQGFEIDVVPEAPQASLLAVMAVIDLAGGAARAPDAGTRARVLSFINGKAGRQMTAGRTLLVRRGNRIAIRRECRDLRDMTLAPGQVALWDGRFRVRNLSCVTRLRVFAGPGESCAPSLERSGQVHDPVDGVAGGFMAEPLAGRAGYLSADYAWPVTRHILRLAGKASPLPPVLRRDD